MHKIKAYLILFFDTIINDALSFIANINYEK